MRRFPLAGPAGLALLLLRGPASADTPATTQWVLATACCGAGTKSYEFAGANAFGFGGTP